MCVRVCVALSLLVLTLDSLESQFLSQQRPTFKKLTGSETLKSIQQVASLQLFSMEPRLVSFS